MVLGSVPGPPKKFQVWEEEAEGEVRLGEGWEKDEGTAAGAWQCQEKRKRIKKPRTRLPLCFSLLHWACHSLCWWGNASSFTRSADWRILHVYLSIYINICIYSFWLVRCFSQIAEQTEQPLQQQGICTFRCAHWWFPHHNLALCTFVGYLWRGISYILGKGSYWSRKNNHERENMTEGVGNRRKILTILAQKLRALSHVRVIRVYNAMHPKYQGDLHHWFGWDRIGTQAWK